MFSSAFYYRLKPLVPRRVQIALRRQIVRKKLRSYADVWPIDERAATPPDGWQGWPDGKKFALVITHDVESARGLDKAHKLARLDRELGFRSSFNFVAEGYKVPETLRRDLAKLGFEVGVHGLAHSGNPYTSREKFSRDAQKINHYLAEWECAGFRTPSMYHNLDWLHDLNLEYDSSTFDTDPFEPQPDSAGTIFPFWVPRGSGNGGYVELPYTLPQDFTLYILMGEQNTGMWKAKLNWIARHGGMALLLAHPDYMHFDGKRRRSDEYPATFYTEFLEYVRKRHEGEYWNALPKDVARYWREAMCTSPQSAAASSSVTPVADSLDSAASCKETQHITHNTSLPGPHNTQHITLNTKNAPRKLIWVDLDNSPHVPFFYPIIAELKKQNYDVLLTARDCSQTCGLADLFSMKYRRIGRHYGKSRILKVAGTILRALQLSRMANGQKPHLAVSHGSRAQMLSALMQGIPALVIMDYEHVEGFIRPTWIMMPEIISNGAVKCDAAHLLKYPGIKEDVYVPAFKPDPGIKSELGIGENELLVTIRPPATEAHYHNPEAEVLFSKAVNLLGVMDKVRMVVLPRNDAQKESITKVWREWCSSRKIIIPDQVVDGLNLLWYSDLAISGGGTMNREAAALGVPVYSIFRGKIGDVDRYLARTGRLVLLESVKDIETRLVVQKRSIPSDLASVNRLALKGVVDGIVKAVEARS